MSYGYLGDTSTSIKQQVKNAGVLSVSDVLDLEGKGHLGGSLELISETSFSSNQNLDLTNIKEDIYDVHIVQVTQDCTGDPQNFIRLSNDNGSTFEASNYKYAWYLNDSVSSGGETRSNNSTQMYLNYGGGIGANELQNFTYIFYDLGNPNKYSTVTQQTVNLSSIASVHSFIGGASYSVAETINAIRLYIVSGTRDGTAKLYGYKQ
jgi:hypothetical protein